jgi:two-component system, NtrC family, response regulator GlrR
MQRALLAQLVGSSPVFLAVAERVAVLSRCDVSVLIHGETGTGKEVVARAIHYSSGRADRPFIPVNCGALPLELVENELFGHERSAFTGATSSTPGLVEEAEGGTLFLDEIDSLPMLAQVKLLRFLQDRQYRRLGSARPRQADVRILSATNVDPEQAVQTGRLRQDLYYRVNVVSIAMPPLRERPEDIPLLARHFLERYSRELGKRVAGLSDAAIQRLCEEIWPGNVRQLEHAVQRAVLVTADGAPVEADAFELRSRSSSGLGFKQQKARAIEEFERRILNQALAQHQGNITRAAAAVQQHRRAFFRLVRKHRIDPARFREQRSP